MSSPVNDNDDGKGVRKVAVLGGTFNPIHYGHLRVAEEVREALGLDRVIFIPAYQPPHKEDGELIEPASRLEMIRMAISDNPTFEVSDVEIRRGGRSYTIDTVKELKGLGLEPTIITGCDQFNAISTWRSYEELFMLADFAVVPRPGSPVRGIAEVMPVELAEKFWYDKKNNTYLNPSGHRVTYLRTVFLEISSTDIRRRIREGMSVRYLLPQQVERYIMEKGLYR